LGNVLTISFSHLLHDIYSSFLAPILPLLIDKMQIGYTLAGFLSFVQRVPALLNPLVGLLADKVSVKYFVILAPSITSIAMSLLGVAPTYVVLMILCFTMGVSAAIFHVPAPVMIKQVAGDRVGKGMSFYMMGGELARTLGPLTILGAVSLWGLEGTYRLIPFGIFTSFLLFFRIRTLKITANFNNDKKITGIKKTLSQFSSLFYSIAGFTASRALMKSALTTFLPTFLMANGASLWMGGISLAAIQFSGALGTLFCGSLSDKLGREKTLMLIALSSPVLMLIFMITGGVFRFIVLLFMGFFLFAPNPVMLAMVQELPSDRPAFLNSIYMTINFLIGAITNVLIGIMADLVGWEISYFIAAGLSILALPFVMRLKKIA